MSNALELYPALALVQPSLAALTPASTPLEVPAGTVLFTEHAPCLGFPLVLEGEIKVSRHSADGRSLELYRVVPGELCLVSSACLFRSEPLSARGTTTHPTRLILVAPAVFTQWLETPAFRNHVLGLFAERMADLTTLIDAIAFHKLDRRLAASLLGHGQVLHSTRRRTGHRARDRHTPAAPLRARGLGQPGARTYPDHPERRAA